MSDGLDFAAPVQELEGQVDATQEASEEAAGERSGDAEQEQSGGDRRRADDVDGGNAELADGRARAVRGTRHRRATLALGTQVNNAGEETGAPSSERQDRARDPMRVNIVAGRSSKLSLPAGALPSEEQLFTRTERGGRRVTHTRGTNVVPNVQPRMKRENLFIGGAPNAADVRQGGIGDCYFESVLLALCANDPGKLTSMMSIAGNQVSINFFRRDDAGSWVNKNITTSTTLLTRKDSEGNPYLVGAGMRIAPQPAECQWWVQLRGSTLEVHRRDIYETGLWAPMIEKAYADYAQRYGRYGTGKNDDERAAGSGYLILNMGGGSEKVYPLFYGAAATEGRQGINFTPGQNVVTDNPRALRRLLQFESQRSNTGPGQTQTHMHARIGSNGAATRGRDLIDQIKVMLMVEEVGDMVDEAINPDDPAAMVDRLLRGIDRTLLTAQLDALRNVLANFLAGTASTDDVATACVPLFTPGLYQRLWDDSAPAPFKHLRQNLGTLANLGSDNGPGRRHVYAAHAYHIMSVNLRDASDGVLALTSADIPARSNEIDADKSFVMVENPHARNESDLDGSGAPDGVNEGRFRMTLDEFLRSFDLLRYSNVQH